MRAYFVVVALLSFTSTAWACDNLTPNCTPANVQFDQAQKGPVVPDPLLSPITNRENAVRVTPNG